jgi:hypothetical protein
MKSAFLRVFVALYIFPVFVFCQKDDNTYKNDSSKAFFSLNKNIDTLFRQDSLSGQELSPLDIGAKRGLFITTPDKKMQMRIMGSVRMYTWYDSRILNSPNNFNTYNIPVDSNNQFVPNFYFTVNQTRFGFEVTRITDIGQIFVRLEMDFLGPNNNLRIRHAYGQYKNWLIGQTWTLFMDLKTQPLTVDRNGPSGNIKTRTPQIRYTNTFAKKFIFDLGLEYSEPQYQSPDSIQSSSIMAFPSLTGRLSYSNKNLELQFSAILSRLVFKYNNYDNSYLTGYGFLFSGNILPLEKKNDKISAMFTYVNSMTHFITTFSNAGLDAVFNPNSGKFASLSAIGTYLAYTRNLTKGIDVTLSGGYAYIFNKSYQAENAYRESFNLALDGFWNIYEGTRLGAEYVFGWRYNKNFDHSTSSRVALLFYYDF